MCVSIISGWSYREWLFCRLVVEVFEELLGDDERLLQWVVVGMARRRTLDQILQTTRQSLKTSLDAPDVFGKRKSVPGKIRIRASIFTSIFMLFYINIPFKLTVSDALRIAIKHECIF